MDTLIVEVENVGEEDMFFEEFFSEIHGFYLQKRLSEEEFLARIEKFKKSKNGIASRVSFGNVISEGGAIVIGASKKTYFWAKQLRKDNPSEGLLRKKTVY